MATYNRLDELECIDRDYIGRLQDVGIRSVKSLLKKGRSHQGRLAISIVTGIPEKQLLLWVNRADLYRVKGIGQEYSELLLKSGVVGLEQLKNASPCRIQELMEAANFCSEKVLVRILPTQKQVQSWIDQANELPRLITY